MSVSLGEARAPVGLRIYAVGDVHGCLAQLRHMLAMIDADLQQRPVEDHRVIFVGDYSDRGPDSKGVVYALMGLTARDKRVICLRGNHDMFVHNFLRDPHEHGPMFYRNGGAATLRSYGSRARDAFPEPVELHQVHVFAELLVNWHHLNFLGHLPTSVSFGDYFFCHAGVRPGVPLDEQSDDDLVWIRDDFLGHKGLYEKVIIHGHTSRSNIDVQPNRINLDTKCHASGTLSAVVLEGPDHRFLQTGGAD